MIILYKANKGGTAKFALYVSLQLPQVFGVKMNDDFNEQQHMLDLREGKFVGEQPAHPNFIDGELAMVTAQLLKVMQPFELEDIKLHHDKRKLLLQYYQDYYALHITDFGPMKTLQVLHEVLG